MSEHNEKKNIENIINEMNSGYTNGSNTNGHNKDRNKSIIKFLKYIPVIGDAVIELENEIKDTREILKHTDMDKRIESKCNQLYIKYGEILGALKDTLNCEVEIKRIKEDKNGNKKISEIKNSFNEKKEIYPKIEPNSLTSFIVSDKKPHLFRSLMSASLYSVDTSKGIVEKAQIKLPVGKGIEMMMHYNSHYKNKKGCEIYETPFFYEDEFMGTISIKGDKIENKHIQLLETRKENIGRSIREHEISEETHWKSEHDGLTGLYNRKYLDQMLDTQLSNAMDFFKTEGYRVSVFMIDIDYFKKNINDKYGHQKGDYVLKETAKRIESFCKKESGRDATIARYGGEEFAVILPGRGYKRYEDHEGALSLAKKLRKYIADDSYEGIDEKVTISIGVSDSELTIDYTKIKSDYPEFAQFEKSRDELVKSIGSKDLNKKNKAYHNFYSNIPIFGRAIINCADTALYDAKNSGRNRVRVFNPNKIYNGNGNK